MITNPLNLLAQAYMLKAKDSTLTILIIYFIILTEVKMKTITVRVCQDQKFLDSFWNFDIKTELIEALRSFMRQFPGIDFKMSEIKAWKSPGVDDLSLYPLSIIKQIEGPDIVNELVRGHLRSGISNSERLKYLTEEMENIMAEIKAGENALEYLLGFFAGRFEGDIKYAFSESLKRNLPPQEDCISIGFTGKIFRFTHAEAQKGSLGWSYINSINTERPLVIIGTWLNSNASPRNVILHELGHVFGANHSKEKNSVMFEETSENMSDIFDKKNVALIRKKIMEL